MKLNRIISGIGLIVIISLGFNNCSDQVVFHGDPSTDILRSKDILVGNPLVSKMLLAKMCTVIATCHPEISTTACEAGVMGTSGFDFQFGFPVSGAKQYSEIIQAEAAGAVKPNATAASTCAFAIEKLSCGDSSVQGAYNFSAKDPFAGVVFMVPTLPGSCPQVFNQPVARSEYFVSTTGSDLNDGSVNKPWATITHASNALVAGPEGATVHVAPGNYYPPTSASCVVTQGFSNSCGILTAKSGTATGPIIYISDQTWGAKIIPADAFSAWYNSGDFVRIIGFEIIGNAATNIGVQSDGSFVRIESNRIHDIPVSLGCSRGIGGGGIVHTNATAHDDDSIGNMVHDIGPFPGNGQPFAAYCNHAHGIYHQQPRGNIQNNLIYRVGSWGISSWFTATNLNISNNLLFNNGNSDSTGFLVGGAIVIAASPGSTHDSSTISNNIIRNNSGKGLDDQLNTGTQNVFLNNVLYANGRSYNLKSGTTPVGSILMDPLMINFKADGTGDYRLLWGSPAINSGIYACASGSNCTPDRDYSGFLRPFGAGLDIGPYEWHP
jgi:hypothetical protein